MAKASDSNGKWVKPVELEFNEPKIKDPLERGKHVRAVLARYQIKAGRQIDVVKAIGRP